MKDFFHGLLCFYISQININIKNTCFLITSYVNMAKSFFEVLLVKSYSKKFLLFICFDRFSDYTLNLLRYRLQKSFRLCDTQEYC